MGGYADGFAATLSKDGWQSVLSTPSESNMRRFAAALGFGQPPASLGPQLEAKYSDGVGPAALSSAQPAATAAEEWEGEAERDGEDYSSESQPALQSVDCQSPGAIQHAIDANFARLHEGVRVQEPVPPPQADAHFARLVARRAL